MKKIFNSFVAIVLFCAMCFLGGEWPDNTPRKKVIMCDGTAIGIVAVCGLYLKNEHKHGRIR